MVSAIADVLKNSIGEMPWIERYTGLITVASKVNYVTGENNVQVPNGTKVYPVSCDINEEECWQNNKYKFFAPDSNVAAIGYFVDNGGAQFDSIQGPKAGLIRYRFDIRFLLWMNLRRLGKDDCNFSGTVTPFIIAKLHGKHSSDGVFGGGVKEMLYKNITVTGVRQLVKNINMFEPFTFAKDGSTRGLFLSPYDYLGLQITGTFDIDKNCMPDYSPVQLTTNGTPLFGNECLTQ